MIRRRVVDADADKPAEQAQAAEGVPNHARFRKVNLVNRSIRTAVLGKHWPGDAEFDPGAKVISDNT
jgi:hypothetical protein